MQVEKLRIGVLASGRGSNLQAIIDACEKDSLPAEVVLVISDNFEAAALKRARKHGIDAIHIDPLSKENKEDYESCIVRELKLRNVQLICLAGYMRLVGKVLLEAYPNKIINIHPSLLPSFKGLDAQAQALNYGVRYSGCTVHFVDSGMDTGPIILQAVVPIYPGDGEDDLSSRILKKEHTVYPQAIKLFAEGRLKLEGRKVFIL